MSAWSTKYKRLVIWDTWPMWLMRHDNLKIGALAPHLWRMLK